VTGFVNRATYLCLILLCTTIPRDGILGTQLARDIPPTRPRTVSELTQPLFLMQDICLHSVPFRELLIANA